MIWRSLEFSEMQEALHGHLPTFHGFIWTPRGEDEKFAAHDLQADGPRRALTYFNVLNGPCPEWHSDWMDFVRAEFPMIPGAIFPWFRCGGNVGREIIRWWDVTPQLMQRAANLMSDLSVGGFFLDQFWLEPKWWMFSEEGTPFSTITPEQIAGWKQRITAFRDVFLAPRVPDVYVNGEWHAYPKLYLENSQANWTEAMGYMDRSHDHILSCDPRFEATLNALGQRVALSNVALSSPEQEAVRQGYILLEGYWQARTLPD